MNRLPSEWRRLDAPTSPALMPPAQADLIDGTQLVDDTGPRARTGAATGPPWPISRCAVAPLARGAAGPGLARAGHCRVREDGHQLWFSLAQPVPVAQRLLACRPVTWGRRCSPRGPVANDRHPARPQGVRHAAVIPAEPDRPEHWSAFVAPDLAPIFNDTPWLDLPPNLEGQAELLARLVSISPDEWEVAQAQLGVTRAAPPTATPAAPPEHRPRPRQPSPALHPNAVRTPTRAVSCST